jgi:hypothetical protein
LAGNELVHQCSLAVANVKVPGGLWGEPSDHPALNSIGKLKGHEHPVTWMAPSYYLFVCLLENCLYWAAAAGAKMHLAVLCKIDE